MASPSFDTFFESICDKLKGSLRVEKLSKSFSELQTDEDRVGMASAIFKEFKLLLSNYVCDNGDKDVAKSVSLRNQGNNAFQRKDDNQALRLYTECIAFAPFPCEHSRTEFTVVNSKKDVNEIDALPLGFANRSSVLFSIGQYEACLADIQRALNYNYPSNLKYKLLTRKGRCLQHQGKLEEAHVCYLEAIQSLTSSSLTDLKKKSMQESMKSMLQGLKSLELSNDMAPPRQQNTVPPKSYRQHDRIVSASSCVDVQFSPEKGRFIQATRDIRPGDVIVVEKPYASVLLPNCYKTHCFNCFQREVALVPCLHCSLVMYCSEACRKESWEKSHRIDCRLLPVLLKLDIHKMGYLALQIVMVASACGKKLQELCREVKRLKQQGRQDVGLYKSDDYSTIYGLIGNTERRSVGDLFRRAVLAACLLDLLDTKSDFFSEDARRSAGTVGGLLLRHLQNLPCNAHEVSDYVREVLADKKVTSRSCEIGAAAYATLSLLNHSCDPNVTRTSHAGDIAVLRAIRPIRMGEEIVDNYGYHFALHNRQERLSSLKAQYYFECECEACTFEWPLYIDLDISIPAYKCSKCGHCDSIPQHGFDLKMSNGKCTNSGHNIKCSQCRCERDMLELESSSLQFEENLTRLLAGHGMGIEPLLVKHLELLDNCTLRPWRGYNDCQEALKECFFKTGNYYV